MQHSKFVSQAHTFDMSQWFERIQLVRSWKALLHGADDVWQEHEI